MSTFNISFPGKGRRLNAISLPGKVRKHSTTRPGKITMIQSGNGAAQITTQYDISLQDQQRIAAELGGELKQGAQQRTAQPTIGQSARPLRSIK